jgi:signal transduction histidine kinase
MPPFFNKQAKIKVFYLLVLGIGYGLAIALYPSISPGEGIHLYFVETYFGCIGASIALSLLAILFKPGMALYVLLFLRCYVLGIMGYSIGGVLSVKLVLSIGLMVELGFLVPPPLNLALSALAIAGIVGAQVLPLLFGSNALVDRVAPPDLGDLAVLCFVLAFAALASSWMGRSASRQKEIGDIIRLQEANLDTLAELNENLQGYARTVDEESTERERNRISREIHDISGYIFTNLIALMDAAGSMRPDDQEGLSDILVTARTQAQEGLRETRAALRKLRKEKPETLDSTQAIFKIVSIFRKIAGIEVELNMGNLPHFLAQDLNLALYRTVQEGLTNAVRHGKATEVRVSFWVESGDVLLSLSDNGRGAAEVVKGIGLTGMEERICALGGTIDFGKAPEGGFFLSIRVPLKLASAGD